MEPQLAKSIGTAARTIRSSLGMTQREAAKRIGVSVEFYARIERGTALPSIRTFIRLSHVLGVSTDCLLGPSQPGLTEQQQRLQAPACTPPHDSVELQRLTRLLRKLSPATLRMVLSIVEELQRYIASEGEYGELKRRK
jgi:transcriptional regulator with XRE-family HTH domain